MQAKSYENQLRNEKWKVNPYEAKQKTNKTTNEKDSKMKSWNNRERWYPTTHKFCVRYQCFLFFFTKRAYWSFITVGTGSMHNVYFGMWNN